MKSTDESKTNSVCVFVCFVSKCGLCHQENCSSASSFCPTSTLEEFGASSVLSCSRV